MRHKHFVTVNTEHSPCEYVRISGWRERIDFYNPSPRHPLYEYRTDEYGRKSWEGNFDPSNGTYVDGYYFARQWWAVERFWLLSNPFYMQGYCEELKARDGERVMLHAVDMDGDLYYPLYIEISPNGEAVRFYEKVR